MDFIVDYDSLKGFFDGHLVHLGNSFMENVRFDFKQRKSGLLSPE